MAISEKQLAKELEDLGELLYHAQTKLFKIQAHLIDNKTPHTDAKAVMHWKEEND